jgi:DNA-binding MarR family transcriptional regulator
MAKNPKLSLENQICHSLYSATNAMVRAYRPLLDELDLTYPQYLVMLALWEEDGVMIKNLVERTRIDPGTLTPLLKRMQLKSLINMTKSDEDSRQKVVVLTKEGQALIEISYCVISICQNKMPQNLNGYQKNYFYCYPSKSLTNKSLKRIVFNSWQVSALITF